MLKSKVSDVKIGLEYFKCKSLLLQYCISRFGHNGFYSVLLLKLKQRNIDQTKRLKTMQNNSIAGKVMQSFWHRFQFSSRILNAGILGNIWNKISRFESSVLLLIYVKFKHPNVDFNLYDFAVLFICPIILEIVYH